MIWRWLASLLVIALVALAGLLAVIMGTERGTAWLATEVALLSDGAVRLSGVQGTVVEGLRIAELRIVARRTGFRARQVTLRLQVAELLRGRLAIEEIGAEHVAVAVAGDASAPARPFVMPTISVPLPVTVTALRIGALEVRSGGSSRTVTGITLSGSMQATQLDLADARAALAGLELHVAGTAGLNAELPLDLRVEWRLAEPALSGAGTLRGRLAAIAIEQRLRVPDPVVITGTLTNVADDPRLAAAAGWESLHYDVPGIGVTRASAGQAQFAGSFTSWKARLSAALQAEGWPDAQARGDIHAEDGRIVFDDLRLDGAFGAVSAQGTLDLETNPRLRLAVTATHIKTAAFRAGLDGRLSARVDLDARLPEAADIRLTQLQGRLMGRPLAGSGDIAYRDGDVAFKRVALSAGPNRLYADGTAGVRLAGRFSLDAPDLSVLWPGLAGRLAAKARLSGTRAQPVVEVDAEGSGLGLGENHLRGLDLRVRVDRQRRVEASAAAQGIRVGERVIGNLEASLAGTLDAHRLTAQLSGGALAARLASAGSWNGTTLRHRVESAGISEATLGDWRLTGEPAVALQADAATIGPHCWEQPPTTWCVATVEWSPGRARLEGELRDLELQRLDRWLAEDLAITGRAHSSISLELTADGIIGSARSRLAEATVYYTGGDEPLVTHFDTATLDAAFTPEAATAILELAGQGLRLSGKGRMQAPLGAGAALDAELAGELADIAPLVPLFAGDFDLAEVAGRVSLDTTVGGTLRAPQLTGVARLSGGTLALPGVGVNLEAIDIALLGDGSSVLRLQGSAQAGGPLTLSGDVRPLEAGGPQLRLRIHGNRIDAVRLPDRFVKASPDVTVHYRAGAISTAGSITIPRAEIVIRELPATAVSVSSDAVVRDREAPSADDEPGQVIGGEIALILGRDVRLKAFGLDTLLEGTVKLSQGADREPKGYGVVRLKEGKFGAYGKELTIERGSLGFAGPLDDPAVELRASRRVDWEGKSVTAGILVSGTASRPESRVFSDPAMSEADALSYLISGRPLQSANVNDRSSIAGAALALGVQQTSPLTERLGSAVTLDELGMQGGTFEETEIVAGKQINPDLYVRFTYGLFNRIGTVLARYKIGRNVSIEAGSGEDQSLDLIYTVEKD